tara:strand:+ start:606 stop:881 length:276 start_codon:yes stop_codon:yes gene_type:complete
MFSKGTHVVGTTFSIKSSTKARRESRDTCFFRRLLEIAKGASKVGLGAPALNPDAPTVTSCLPQFSYQLIDVGQLTLSLHRVALEKLCNKH